MFRTKVCCAAAFVALTATAIAAPKEDQKLVPIEFSKVELTDQFWMPRLVTQKETLVPFALGKAESAIENLQKTANYLKKKKEGLTVPKEELPFPHRYISSDLYKIMEGAASLLATQRDPALEAQMDSIIDIIGAAQQEDGYLYEAHIAGVAKDHPWGYWGGAGMGDRPYSWVIHSHELYDMGHMYEGAVAYYLATGKRKWLDIAEKNAQHVNRVFFVGDPNYNDGKPVNQAPGHEEIELALIKMYRVTGNELYRDMAKKFIDIRGVTYKPEGEGVMDPVYSQQHLPVREQNEAVGHSVRATYLYSGMADVGAQTGDTTLQPALEDIWDNIVDTRMHITGGLGAIHGIEGFGPEYELPNKDAYLETCAAVGNVFFNYRMYLMEKDARFMDVAEVALFNNVLAGVNFAGNKFFYVNPLEADGHTPFNHGRPGRSPWFGTACCPSNLARLIPQVPGMMYAHTDDEIYCSLYASSEVSVPQKAGAVALKQTTGYPFDETIVIEVTPAKKNQQIDIKLRIPSWVDKQFVPGKLYSYINTSDLKWQVKVNGKVVDAQVEKGFASVSRKWKAGDKVELYLPMPVRYNKADERVAADRGRVAITRGPLVYCAEGVDNGGQVAQFFMPSTPDGKVYVNETGVLKGVEFISLPAQEKLANGATQAAAVTMVPYYAWDNRDDGTMNVWFPTSASMVKLPEVVTLENGKFKTLDASSGKASLTAIADGQTPAGSADNSQPSWNSLEQKGKAQWVEIGLKKPTSIQSISIYWTDNGADVLVPASWNLEYMDGSEWKEFPLYTTDSYSLFKDQFNMVHVSRPITTEKFRINVRPQKDAAGGIAEVVVEEGK